MTTPRVPSHYATTSHSSNSGAAHELHTLSQPNSPIFGTGFGEQPEWIPTPPFVTSQSHVVLLEGGWFRRSELLRLLPSHRDSSGYYRFKGIGVLSSENAGTRDELVCLVDGVVIGEVPAKEALPIAPALAQLASHHRLLQVDVTIRWNGLERSAVEAYIQVPRARDIAPANQYPQAPWVLIPQGRKVPFPVKTPSPDLRHSLESYGLRNLALTAHSTHELRARSAIESVLLNFGNESVGIVPAKHAGGLLAVVKIAERYGLVPVLLANFVPARRSLTLEVDALGIEDIGPQFVSSTQSIAHAVGFRLPDAPSATSMN